MASGDSADGASRDARIYAAIRAVPRGHVVTYGQVAMLAEIPRGHRVVAAALRMSSSSMRLPWQRVLAKHSRTKGRIAMQGEAADEQRARLEGEGVHVDADGVVSMSDYGWLPLD